MSKAETTSFHTCLKKARLRAGYENRGTAAMHVHYSPEVIGRHERGEYPVSPEDVLNYAGVYGSPDLLIRYCGECSVGNVLKKVCDDKSFSHAVTRLVNRLNKAEKLAKKLSKIADKGMVDEDEKAEFIKAIRGVKEIKDALYELKLWAFTHGVITPDDLNNG